MSPGVIRAFKCNVGCGGCCRPFTLDWHTNEPCSDDAQSRTVEFNGRTFTVMTFANDQRNIDKWGWGRCNKLDFDTSYCTIHKTRPLSCDFEILRITKHRTHNHLTNRFFGRGWSFIAIETGKRGALCELFPATEEGRSETIRKLYRLKEWSDFFEIKTYLPQVIAWITHLPLDATKNITFVPDSENTVFSYLSGG